jgi:hypothetical protein
VDPGRRSGPDRCRPDRWEGAGARSALALGLGALLGVALAPACDDKPSEPSDGAPISEAHARQDWPPGTVLAIEGVPITADEVDRASVYVQTIELSATGPQLRRLALENIVLRRAIARLLAPEEHTKAAREAADLHARLAGKITDVGPGVDPAAGAKQVTGTFQSLGLVTWGAALELPEGQWSEPIEDIGQWVVLRRTGLREGAVPMATEVSIEAFVFPWLPADQGASVIESAYDRLHLEIVDPAWREIVPELTQYRMGARKP